VRANYADRADAVLAAYPASSEAEVQQAATALASDRFIAFSTWKWYELHKKTGGKPTFLYFYSRPRPAMTNGSNGPAHGAAHSAEIEYAMGNLDTNKTYAWTAEDRKISEVMQGYFANFVKTGDPNGAALPKWSPDKRQRIDVDTHAEPVPSAERFKLLDEIFSKPLPPPTATSSR
jgi:para-nitrobenzyl esterase